MKKTQMQFIIIIFIFFSGWKLYKPVTIKDPKELYDLNKVFYNKRNLNREENNQSRYPCEKCHKVYNRLSNLQQHIKTGCYQKPRYACHYCNYITKRKYEVFAHVRNIHPEYKVICRDLEDPTAIIVPR